MVVIKPPHSSYQLMDGIEREIASRVRLVLHMAKLLRLGHNGALGKVFMLNTIEANSVW